MEDQMNLKNRFSFLILMLAFTVSAKTWAADMEPEGKCFAEAKKLCPNLTKGNGLGKCLRAHKSEFSQECQDKGIERKSHLKVAMKDCREDAKKVCAGVERGEGRIVKCLRENTDKLSPSCKAHLEKTPNP
jgi:hypothetical protein